MLGASMHSDSVVCPHCGEDIELQRTAPAPPSDDGELMTPAAVARLFAVDPKTVARWAEAGKLRAVRTLGGHRRFHADEVHAMLRARVAPADERTLAHDDPEDPGTT